VVRSRVLGLAGHLFGTFVELHYSHCLLGDCRAPSAIHNKYSYDLCRLLYYFTTGRNHCLVYNRGSSGQ